MRITQIDTPKTDDELGRIVLKMDTFSYDEVRFTVLEIPGYPQPKPNVSIGGYGMIVRNGVSPERGLFLARSFAVAAITHFGGIPG